MDIIAIIISFEIKTAGLFLLFIISSASLFFAIHVFLNETTHKHKIAFAGLCITLWTLATISGYHGAKQLIAVPSVTKTTPAINGTIDVLHPTITYTFNTPVNLDTLVVNTYPEMDLDIQPHGYFGNRISVGRTLTVSSKNTLPPGENIIVYLSNIEGPFTRGYGGEYQLDIKTDDLGIIEMAPDNTVTTIASNQTFTVKLNEAIRTEKEWTVQSVPEHSFTIRKSDTQSFTITPQTPLKQATQYTMMIVHNPIVYRLGTDEEVTTLPPKIKKTFYFTTVKPPILADIQPQGSGINPAEPIKILFDAPIDRSTITNRLTLTPETTLTPQWDAEGKILILTHKTFPKDTNYVLSLKKGIKTLAGGQMETDLTYQFHTAGVVNIAQTTPANKSTDVSITLPITLTFDQQVPSNIAEFIEFSPKITATTSAQGRTVTFFPSTPLTHEMLYKITLKKGAPSVYGLPSVKDQMFSFTTSPNALAVPFFRQQSAFTCNIAAARMLLAYRKIEVTEKNLIDAVGSSGKRGTGNPHKGYIDDYGTYWEAILRAVNSYKPAHLITGGKLSDIISEVKKGNPVMTWGQNGWSDPHDISWTATDGTYIKAINGMHSAVVRGYTGPDNNPTQILLNDPWRGQYAITTKEFMRRWGYIGVALALD